MALLYRSVLDHGYVSILNLAGPVRRPDCRVDADDTDPARAARMSFNASGQDRPRDLDLRLSRYLLTHRHLTPFEMVECWVEMRVPIFVARQFVRHRTARTMDESDCIDDPSINEVSARYTQLERLFYIPRLGVIGTRPPSIKQGRDIGAPLTDEAIAANEAYVERLTAGSTRAFDDYEAALAAGIPPELARLHLPLNTYTTWLWKQDLRNVLGFLSLRLDGHAQWEPQQYARALHSLLAVLLPDTMRIFDEVGVAS